MKASLVYTGIRVKNLDESVRFYRDLFGMTEQGRSKISATGGEVASMVSIKGGHELELNYYPEGSEYAPEYAAGEELDHLAFKVDDLDKALAELEKAGYPKVMEIKSATSKWVYVQDPNGIFIELFA